MAAISLAAVCEVLRFLTQHYAQYRAKKTGLVLVSCLNYLIKSSLFKKNLEMNYQLDEQGYTSMLDKQTASFLTYPEYHLHVMDLIFYIIFTLCLGVYLFRFNLFIGLVIAFIGYLLSSTVIGKFVRSASISEQSARKNRTNTVISVLRLKNYAKARAFETVFYNMIQAARLKEITARHSV